MTAQRIKVLLVDDHVVVRAGFRHLLEKRDNYDVSEASTAEEAYSLYEKLEPDVVVLDISMPGMGGMEGLRRLLHRHNGARVLVLSMYDDPAYVSRAMKIGARGYISKNSAADSLDKAIVKIISGDEYFSADIEGQRQNRAKDFDSETLGLSTREFEVLRLLAEGRTVGQIADNLNLSPKTVSNHRSHLMDKLKLTSTADLVRFAIRQGVVNA